MRLLANYLHEFNWTPLILTVHERHYEEPPSPELTQLVRDDIEVIKVEANPATTFGIRTFGDIGLRAFKQIKRAAHSLCHERNIDFIWFSIPSWYPPLMGKGLKQAFNVPFGIDYQDPWVYPLPEGTPALSRAKLTQWAARKLEPQALKTCDLITGIHPAYFEGALSRNPHRTPHTAAFQLGFDPNDHNREVDVLPPWQSNQSVLLYPGAYLPLSAPFYTSLFKACQALISQGDWPDDTLLAFIGTGRPDLPITAIARDFGAEHIVFEQAERIPFLDVQQLLRKSRACLVIGSPEPHYSASKVFQCVLSGRPVIAALHQDSEALQILRASSADQYCSAFDPEKPEALNHDLRDALQLLFTSDPSDWSPTAEGLHPHHAREAARTLSHAMESVIGS